MATDIMSDVNRFGTLAHELVKRLHEADSFNWFNEIAALTIELELARQSERPAQQGDEPAFLILEANSRDRRPDFTSPMIKSLSAIVHGQLGGGVTRLAVMFYRQPNEPKCSDKLLSMTSQGKHSDFHLEINRQTAIHTLQHWSDAVAQANRD